MGFPDGCKAQWSGADGGKVISETHQRNSNEKSNPTKKECPALAGSNSASILSVIILHEIEFIGRILLRFVGGNIKHAIALILSGAKIFLWFPAGTGVAPSLDRRGRELKTRSSAASPSGGRSSRGAGCNRNRFG